MTSGGEPYGDRFRRLIQELDVGVLVQGPALEIRVSNRTARELLGVSEDQLHGRTSYDPAWRIVREDGTAYAVEDRPAATVLRTRRAQRGVVLGIDRPTRGDRVWLLVSVEPELDEHGEVLEVVTTMSDLTERRLLESSLHRAQRLESIGRLAGGIAHDFNNLLTVILANASFVKDQLPAGSPLRTELDEALDAGDRAARLTRQLLTFASRQTTAPRVVRVTDTLDGVRRLLERFLGEHIELRVEVTGELGAIVIDPSQLEQVLVNLAVNARDAMPHGGALTIAAENAELDGTAGAPAGAYVALRVTDTGAGMDETTRERVFEPFFTTKATGAGTGLGLAIVHGVIERHGGHVRVDSAPGKGTTFHVYLPRVSDEPGRRASTASASARRGSERVLLVEDEGAVRRLAARILTEHGYQVLAACDGVEALAVVRGERSPIDLVVTDVVMPGLDGPGLVDALTADRPALRVLYVSGYAPQLEGRAAAWFLAKPYTADELAQKVREVLDADAPGAAP